MVTADTVLQKTTVLPLWVYVVWGSLAQPWLPSGWRRTKHTTQPWPTSTVHSISHTKWGESDSTVRLILEFCKRGCLKGGSNVILEQLVAILSPHEKRVPKKEASNTHTHAHASAYTHTHIYMHAHAYTHTAKRRKISMMLFEPQIQLKLCLPLGLLSYEIINVSFVFPFFFLLWLDEGRSLFSNKLKSSD